MLCRHRTNQEASRVRATKQDGSYPRPMMCREAWGSLDGSWGFAHDDADEGLPARWFLPSTTAPFERRIEVPYPPESPASGVGARGMHPVVWYRRTVRHDEILGSAAEEPADRRVLIHFGAVDYRAQVWFDGRLVASHVGGQAPFTADVTDAMDAVSEHVLVVRAEDDPHDLHQPRGKQDWREEPHSVWYDRTTGIWQPVWFEVVPAQHLVDVAWTPDVPGGVVRGEVTLAKVPVRPLLLDLTVRLGEEVLAEQTYVVRDRITVVDVAVPALRNGQERARLLWMPENPVLLDVEVALREREDRSVVDTVASYTGLRTVSVGGGAFKLNGQPYYLRSVLNQGFRPDTQLASRGTSELRAEVELIKAMGFNAVRVHQKAEDPRFLHWADRLGLIVWAETGSAYEFSSTAVALLMTEWLELVRRDRSHPSVAVWVPLNESWGVQDISTVPAQQAFARSLSNVTRALDPSRPVVSNEGWEHVDSDILGLHDYTLDADELRTRYQDRQSAVDAALAGHGAQGRRPMLGDTQRQAFLAGEAPLMITEFGGISISNDENAWGYGHAGSPEEYAASLAGLFDALRSSTEVVGFCYTQFMDTGQETNGLLFSDGKPKIPIESIFEIVTGRKDSGEQEPTTTFGSTD
jgi:beta-galactosidase/beta-glucuronidase